MDGTLKSKGVTKAYLLWKQAGSPGFVWCTVCDCPAGEGHVHVDEQHVARQHVARVARLIEIGERPEPAPEVEPEVRHVESLTEWYRAGQRKDAVLTMSEWLAAVEQWKSTQ